MREEYHKRITIDPEVMVGKPVIRGTRITVELILRQLAQGITTAEILENYPHLTKEDIYAAIDYGAHLVERERIYPLTTAFYGKAKVLAR